MQRQQEIGIDREVVDQGSLALAEAREKVAPPLAVAAQRFDAVLESHRAAAIAAGGRHVVRGEIVVHAVEQRVNDRSEEHTSELQSQSNLVCRLLLEKKKQQ